MVNCVWYNSNGYSYYGVRALATTTELGTARPEVLVEASYVEAIDRIYRMDATWSYGTKASNTCAYVARKLKRCKAKNTDGVRTALEACPVTCSTC